MNTKKILQSALGIMSVLMIFAATSCGEAAISFEQNDLYGSDAGGTGSATTFITEDGSTIYYMTLEYQKGVRGTVSGDVYTITEDFSWEIDSEGSITLTYWNEPASMIWDDREEKTETLTAAVSDAGSITITNSDNQVYEVDADSENELNAIISSYVDDRTYMDATEAEVLFFGETGGSFNSLNFEWEISDSSMKIYLIHDDDDQYDIIMWTDGSGYYAVDQDGNEYTHNDIPLYIEDEDVTMTNLIGTWIRDDEGETLSLTADNYGLYDFWYIDDEYNVTINSYDFYITYNNDDFREQVELGTASQYYTSTNANITNLYNKD